jgi:hypothetical protein
MNKGKSIRCGLITALAAAASLQAAATVEIDLAETTGPATYRASGLIWSVSVNYPNDELLTQMKFQLYRGRLTPWSFRTGIESMERMSRLGARIQVVVSDEYALRFKLTDDQQWDDNQAFGYQNIRHWPGDNGDFSLWETVLEDCFNRVREKGLEVQWDIWEEPNHEVWWDRSREQFFDTYAHAYRKLKQLDPGAVVVGPSINRCDPDYLKAFLLFARDNKVLPDILSWHEIVEQNFPVNIPDHVENIRAFMRAQDIEVIPIDINEYVAPSRQTNPGSHVWYITCLEEAEVNGACKATWMDEKENIYNAWWPQLGGLLTYPDRQPRSTWWVYRAYGRITGELVRVQPNKWMTGLAGIDPAQRHINILLGRNGHGYADSSVLIKNLQRAPWLMRDGRVRVIAKRIPNTGWNVLGYPAPVMDTVLPINDNRLRLEFPGLGLNEALTIELLNPDADYVP